MVVSMARGQYDPRRWRGSSRKATRNPRRSLPTRIAWVDRDCTAQNRGGTMWDS